MNPVLAGIALVLLVVFAALAVSRKRREKQNWQPLAGLAAVFAVALAVSLFLPPFEAAPPAAAAPGATAPSGPESVVLEGVLKKQLEKCADEWCFSIEVLNVISGPAELEGAAGLEIRTGKKVILFADKLVRVTGVLKDGYAEAAHTDILLVDAQGNAVAAEVVETEAQPEGEAGVAVELEGIVAGDWEQCGSKWCADFAAAIAAPAEAELPQVVKIRHSGKITGPVILHITGTYKDGIVDVKYVGVVDVIG